jgi:hypothetical protein
LQPLHDHLVGLLKASPKLFCSESISLGNMLLTSLMARAVSPLAIFQTLRQKADAGAVRGDEAA